MELIDQWMKESIKEVGPTFNGSSRSSWRRDSKGKLETMS